MFDIYLDNIFLVSAHEDVMVDVIVGHPTALGSFSLCLMRQN